MARTMMSYRGGTVCQGSSSAYVFHETFSVATAWAWVVKDVFLLPDMRVLATSSL